MYAVELQQYSPRALSVYKREKKKRIVGIGKRGYDANCTTQTEKGFLVKEGGVKGGF